MKFSTKEIVLGAMFVALAIIQAMLLRFLGTLVVPFSLITFVAVLAGIMIGPRAGFLSMLVYVLMGLIGLPVFEKPPYGGLVYVLQPTFGFLLGAILASYMAGKFRPKKNAKNTLGYCGASFLGILVIYVVGLPYLFLMLNLYLGQATSIIRLFEIGFIPFIGLDLIKAVIAAVLASLVVKRIK